MSGGSLAVGPTGIGLPRVLDNPRHKDNIVLAAGDSIHIPEFIPTVRVEGAVNAPVSVTYVRGKRLDYYINAAGGFKSRADRKRTFVQQPNGNVQGVRHRGLLLGSSIPKPEPGATVFVPPRDSTAKGVDVIPLFASIAQIIAATATLVLVITRR